MSQNERPLAVIAMSGGVDSAVSALLLRDMLPDHTVLGVTMSLYRGDDQLSVSDADTISDARAVAQRIGIDHAVCDLGDLFCQHVIQNFCQEYQAGRTPNPCVICNKTIKFGALWDYAREKGADILSTGHYVRREIDKASRRTLLRCAADVTKDQSYVLWSLSQDVLSHTRFPLGEMTKNEVRELAASQGFVNAHRKDSQDICFIPDGDYVSFLSRYAGITPAPGAYLDINGNPIGHHKGMICYTIGQRKGLGMSFGKHMFVCRKDAASNTVTLCEEDQLYRRQVRIDHTNYIPFDRLTSPLRVKAKLRYRHTAEDATLFPADDEHTAYLEFDRPQCAPAAGQSAVMYDGDYVVGGGIICEEK